MSCVLLILSKKGTALKGEILEAGQFSGLKAQRLRLYLDKSESLVLIDVY